MNINFHRNNFTLTSISEKLTNFSNPQIKKILIIVSLVFIGLAAILYHTKRKKLIKVVPKQDFKLTELNQLEKKLSAKILGQPYAVKKTVEALKRHVSGLGNQQAPIGTFLFVGPTGVGKTQLAKELAVELLGNEDRLIRMDMSGFSESHSLTRLIGSLPGYKQHDEGGQLTEQLKKNPHSIILLDEIDKADPDVLKVFLRAFDEGVICDAKGIAINCRNTIFILTTNLGASQILKMSKNKDKIEDILEKIKGNIQNFLSPELYNRLDIAPFLGLGDDQLDDLILSLLNETKTNLFENKQITVDWDRNIIDFVKSNGYDFQLGARPLKRIIDSTVKTVIADAIINDEICSGDTIKVYAQNDKILIEKKI